MLFKLGAATARSVTSVATIVLALAGSLLAGAPARAAAFTCAGEPATIIGPQIGNVTHGTEGDDVILTFNRNDYIRAGGGNDLICSGAGNDTIDAHGGDDISYAEDGNDDVRSGPGSDWMFGGDGNDLLLGQGNDNNAADGGPGTDECSFVRIAISCERN
jgi:Ca2+-binding RTX toxin-like protein